VVAVILVVYRAMNVGDLRHANLVTSQRCSKISLQHNRNGPQRLPARTWNPFSGPLPFACPFSGSRSTPNRSMTSQAARGSQGSPRFGAQW